jgi:hypothetical protein
MSMMEVENTSPRIRADIRRIRTSGNRNSMRMLKFMAPSGLLLLALSLPAQVTPYWLKAKPIKVEARFVKSAYADYLFYLLYRNTGTFPELATAVPLDDIPQLDALISLPEQAASAQVTSYTQIYELAAAYRDAKGRIKPERVKPPGKGWVTRYKILAYSNELPAYDSLMNILSRGEAHFAAFEQFWQQNIAPAEDKQIAAWQTQLASCQPFDKLQHILRIPFPFEKIDIAAIALHLSGSGNTNPPGIYTSLFDKPRLSWVVGHEATHLAIDENAGANWQANPLAPKAIELVKQRGGTPSDIEEALPLFMQVKLSQECGTTGPDYDFSAKLNSSPKRDIVLQMDRDWGHYRKDYEENIIQFWLASAIKALQGGLPPVEAKPATP